jgi:alkylation response protein AidB-like acyl-CoA dehydrogenase
MLTSLAYAGSDVAGLQCTAVPTPDGKHYIINGEKKWIVSFYFCFLATHFCTAGIVLTHMII